MNSGLLFQRKDINVSSAITKLQSAEGSLRLLCDNNGPAVEKQKVKLLMASYMMFNC